MGAGNYVCPVEGCGKRCTNTKDLAEHGRVHTGDRPYRCRFGCTNSDGTPFRVSAQQSMLRHEKRMKCAGRGDRTLEDTPPMPFDSLIVPGMHGLVALGSAAALAAISSGVAMVNAISALEVGGTAPAGVIEAARVEAADAYSRAKLLTDALALAPLVMVDCAPEDAIKTPCACLAISAAARAACQCSDPAGEAARNEKCARLRKAMLALGMSVPWYVAPPRGVAV